MTKPLCILVDDEEGALSALKSTIQDLDLLEIEKCYLDPDLFLTEIDSLSSEIIFLDMDMPIAGDEVARKLKNKKVIFVSGFIDKAIKGFDVNAIDFVQKPTSVSRLKEAIFKAIDKITINQKLFLVIKSQNSKKEEITCDEICFIQGDEQDPRDKMIILKDTTEIKAKNINFDTLMKELPKYFLRVNQGCIINLNLVQSLIDSDTIGLKCGPNKRQIDLSDTYKKDFFLAKPQFK